MKQLAIFSLLGVTIFAVGSSGERTKNSGHLADLNASDGAILKATYFAAPKPVPGALLFHQSNRTRKEWDDVAEQLAAAGINTLTFDVRGHGETGGQESRGEARRKQWPLDLDAAAQYLIFQPVVKVDV